LSKKAKPSLRFITEYRNKKTGKLMRAKDYGYKAWPIRAKAA